jgi:hypothetical protein
MGTIQSTIRKRPQQEERDRKLKDIEAELQGASFRLNSVLLRFDLTSATNESNSVYS